MSAAGGRLAAVPTLVGAVLALLLGAAGVSKALHFARFVDELAGYSMLPPAWLTTAGAALVALEIVAAFLLLVPRLRRNGALLASVLFLLFAAAVGASVSNGRSNSCGCSLPFAGSSPASTSIMLRNALLAVVALALAGEVRVPGLAAVRPGDTTLRRLARIQWWGMAGVLLFLSCSSRQLTVLYAELEADFQQLVHVRPGETFEHLHVTTLDGEEKTLEYVAGRHELLVFSSQCSNCPLAVELFDAIAEVPTVPTTRYGLSISDAESTRRLMAAQKADFPVYLLADMRSARQHGLLQLPAAVIVEDGIVQYAGFVPELRVGQPFADFSVRTLDGGTEVLGFAGREHELVVVTRGCADCDAALAALPPSSGSGAVRRVLWLHQAPPDALALAPEAKDQQRIWDELDVIRRHGSSYHHRRIVIGPDAKVRAVEWLPAAK